MTERKSRTSRRPKAVPSRTAATAPRPSHQPADESTRAQANGRHIVVGIGASAGGLEAFTLLLQRLPMDTGMSFVLVQHLDPERESALSDILSRATQLPVREVGGDQTVEPNHVYVIPPNATLAIADGILKLQPRSRTGPHRSVDAFFESLAQDQRERAIGVILSGTANDGTLGLEAIKAEGGITFAQDDSAKYDSMPQSAIAAGCVDFVLKPEDIANELARIAKHPFVAGQLAEHFSRSEDDRASATAHEDDDTPLPSGGHGTPLTESKQAHAEGQARGKAADNGYKKTLLLLRNHSGVDFSLYKSTTIQRRIARRMVLVNAELQILQFRGPTGAYLEPPTGKASFDVLKMARQGLMLPLRAVINKAKKDSKTARRENVRLAQNGGTRTVNIEVVPLKNLRERCFLILFEDAEKPARTSSTPAQEQAAAPAKAPHAPGRKEESRRVAELEREVAELRDYMQSVLEQHDAANEELQASNEEVQSANEELQSINEELETSKEELESANEELTTVNEEMANRNTELNRLNGDLVNLQTSTKLAILLLGRDLTIRRFSPQAEKEFNLLATDVGRPVSRIRHNLDVTDLEKIVEEVIAGVRESEHDVRDKDGRWYSLRVRPYLTLDNKVDGAVLVLVNIDELKQSEQAASDARDYAEASLRTMPDPLIVLTGDLRIQSANDAFYRTFKLSPGETSGRLIFEADRGAWNIPKLRNLLEEILPRNSFFDDLEITQHFERIGQRTMLLNARTLLQASGQARLILLGIRDITEVLAFQVEVRRSEMRYRRLFETANDGILILDPVSEKITEANPLIMTYSGYAREELLGKELWQIGLLKDEQASQTAFRELQQNGTIRYQDLPLQSKSGETHEVEVVANRYEEDGRQVIQCNIRDVAGRKQMEETRARLAAIVESTDDAIISKTLEGNITSWNQGAERLFGYAAQEAIGQPIAMLMPPNRRQEEPEILARLKRGEHIEQLETIGVRKDGSPLQISLTISPIRDEKGHVIGASRIVRDITERKQAEERERLLTNELAHRSKNLLTVMQAIVSRSLSGKASADEARDTITRRIGALSRSQSLLSNGGVEGGRLAEIIGLEFEAFSERVDASGPDLILNPKSTQTMALLVHELATNATKHGALSRPEGRVAINWSIEGAGAEATFRFQWQERGGPPVAPPTRKGFGRILIEKAVAQDFSAQPKIEFAPEGLRYRIDAPLSAVRGAVLDGPLER